MVGESPYTPTSGGPSSTGSRGEGRPNRDGITPRKLLIGAQIVKASTNSPSGRDQLYSVPSELPQAPDPFNSPDRLKMISSGMGLKEADVVGALDKLLGGLPLMRRWIPPIGLIIPGGATMNGMLGPQGRVLKGRLKIDGGGEKAVAIKILRSVSHSIDDVIHEAKGHLLASVASEHVAPLYGLSLINGSPALVMKPYDASLLSLLEREYPTGIPEQKVVKCILFIARALHDLHTMVGVIHLNVKPSEILVDRGLGSVVISDFASCSVQGKGRSSTASTSAYRAPEQFDNVLGPVGPKSDVYSLGCTMIHLLTRHQPWAGLGLPDIVHRMIERRESLAVPGVPLVSASLSALLKRMVVVEPEGRPTMEEVAEALQGMAGYSGLL